MTTKTDRLSVHNTMVGDTAANLRVPEDFLYHEFIGETTEIEKGKRKGKKEKNIKDKGAHPFFF